MANQSSMNQVNDAFRGMTISLPMKDLFCSVIRAFDLRRLMLDTALVNETEYHPETCLACEGSGFILTPNPPPASDSEEETDGVVQEEEDEDDNNLGTSHSASPGAGSTAAGPSAAGAMTGTSVTVAAAVASLAAAATNALPVPAPATVPPAIVLPSTPAIPAPVTTASAVVTGAVANFVPAPAQGGAPANPGAPTAAMTALTATTVGPYPISSIIPGFHSLGPNSATPTPPPAPLSAVFAGPGEERYYAVTKGIRVGLFGGWQVTSPYVTGVASASFSRHRTLQQAFLAYESAYNMGSVTYV
ncbi:hypothetical protein DFP72DRAFT_850142 [Ephemerocybe angulata]|uniref:Ribonuclease H1 N-terminal domain-containing protein n=1 Tax=Ephemerocybe angulata TaxID=980116 RepID=A0A8H6M410_9AGAR|nr:hypothetical protein DFP72DRAFT_850142 [Tulosesus angulatus]